MELIRNCSHHSSVYLALITDKHNNPKKVRKSSFNKEGTGDLLNEYDGLCWYASRLGVDFREMVILYTYHNSFAILTTKYHPGDLGDPYSPVERNYPRLLRALTYYKDIFGKTGFVCSHGDYSLSNLVFVEDNIDWIIDWEHFNNKLPAEFDVLNCIMEVCYFTYMQNGRFTGSEIAKIQQLLQYAEENIPMSQSSRTSPAQCLAEGYRDNKDIFGSQYSKYPLAACPKDIPRKIDAFFTRH